MRVTMSVVSVALLIGLGTPLQAQQQSVALMAAYSRTPDSDQNAWGAAGEYQLTWGSSAMPVKLGTVLGASHLWVDEGDQQQTSLGFEVTLQPTVGGPLTPYIGGNVSSNWSSGGSEDAGARFGWSALAGASIRLAPQAPLSLLTEISWGQVRGQQHSVGGRLGLSYSL